LGRAYDNAAIRQTSFLLARQKQQELDRSAGHQVGRLEGRIVVFEQGQLLIRFNPITGSYLVLRCGYTDFNDWVADPDYFEESYSITQFKWVETNFNAWVPDVAYVSRPNIDLEDFELWPTITPTYYDPAFGYANWLFEDGWDRQEITQNQFGQLRPVADVGKVWALRSALTRGIDRMTFRYRTSYDDNTYASYDNGTDWLNYRVAAQVQVGNVSPMWPWVGLRAHLQGPTSYYEMRLRQKSSTKLEAVLYKRNGTVPTLLNTSTEWDGLLSGGTYNCELFCVTNNNGTVYLEGRVGGERRVSAYDSPPTLPTPGTVALITREADVAFDNVNVYEAMVQRFESWDESSYGNYTERGWSVLSGKPSGSDVCHLNDNVNIYSFDDSSWNQDASFTTRTQNNWRYEDGRLTDDYGRQSNAKAIWLGSSNGANLRSSLQSAGATRITFYCKNRNTNSVTYVVETSPDGSGWTPKASQTCTSQDSWQFREVPLSQASATYVRIRKTQATSSGQYLGIDTVRIYREPWSYLKTPAIGYPVGEIEVWARRSDETTVGPASYDLQGSTSGLDGTWVTVGSKNDLYGSEVITPFTSGLSGYSYFRVLNTSADDRLRIHAVYIKAADANYASGPSSDFNQSPARDWSAPAGFWYTENQDYKRAGYVGPMVKFDIQTAPTNGSSNFGPDNPNDWETARSFDTASNLSWQSFTFTTQYWDDTFIRIQHTGGDGSLCVDDLTLTEWRGRYHETNQWIAEESWIVQRSGLDAALEFTRSRANPQELQGLIVPWLTNGIGEITFEYRTENGPAELRIERTSTVNSNLFITNFPLVVDEVNAGSWQQDQNAYRLLVRTNAGTPMRLRIRHTSTNLDTRLYVDNVRIKDYPPRDIRTWQVYNALITDNQDTREFDVKTCFLNNDSATDTGGHFFEDDMAYVQSPIMPKGIGEISFWYRNWEPDGSPAATIRMASAPSAETPGSNWTDFCTISGITNTDFAFFKTNIYNTSDRFIRIYCETNPSAVRVALDNVLITEPIAADFRLSNIHTIPEVPIYSDSVFVSAKVTDKLLNPTNIQLQLAYYVSSNNWANWPSTNWIPMTTNGDANTYVTTASIPAQEIDEVVQYAVIATYGGDVVENTGRSPKTSREFDNPPWYYPVDLNAGQVNTNPYYFVFSCPTGAVWINEVNYYSGQGLDNKDYEYVEICGKSGSVVTNWRVELVNGGATPPLYQAYGTYPITNRYYMDESNPNSYGFWILGDPGVSPLDAILSNAQAGNAHIWPPSGGNGNGIRLVRSMGAWADSVCYGTNMPGFRYIGTKKANWIFDAMGPLYASGTGTRPSDFDWVFQNETGLESPGQVNTNQTLISYGSTQTLSVVSLFGGAVPPVGIHTNNRGDWITCSITNSPFYVGVQETQYACVGWTQLGSVPLSAATATNTGPFLLLTDSTITWNWQTNLYLPVSVSGDGSVDVSGWVQRDSSVTVTATPEIYNTFVRWSGDTNGCTVTSNELSFVHSRPRSMITAHFESTDRVLSVASEHGAPAPLTGAWVYRDDDTVTCLVSNRIVLNGTTQYVCQGWTGTGSVPPMPTIGPEIEVSWFSDLLDTWSSQNGQNWILGLYADDGNLTVDPVASNGLSNGDDLLIATAQADYVSPLTQLYLDPVNVDIDEGLQVFTVAFNSTSLVEATHYVVLTNGSEAFFTVNTNQYNAGSADAADWQPLANPVAANPPITTGPFVITNDSTITWLWHTNYYLATHTNGNGTVSTNGWIPAGDAVAVSAQAGQNARFVEWRGTILTTSANPLNLVMLQAHSVTGIFEDAFFTTRGTSYNWLQQFFTSNYVYEDTNDYDTDGALTWMEYVAGTIPTDSNSVFTVLGVLYAGDSNAITWYATTNSGVTVPFDMYRSTNLLDPSPWELLVSNAIERSASGTNTWWDTNPPPNAPAFYRPSITWTNGL
jgi:hypothetical protein